jgi:hypothetical protein
MNLIGWNDPFQIAPGANRIVVGAPHHGTRPNVDADMGTGPIALALAAQLGARAVIASDLRRTVDVNKDPVGQPKAQRHHVLRYQNELFAGLPGLVIEIHGHVTGRYPIEAATGFQLDQDAPGDSVFLECLRVFKGSLDATLPARLGQHYAVGLFPLDRDVKKTATNTFTFQKVRRARNLAGLEWFGLHIELPSELRTGKQAQSRAGVEALAAALAAAIRAAFEPLPAPGATIPLRADDGDDHPAGHPFVVSHAPEKYVEKNIALLHPDDLAAAGALEGDSLELSNNGETMRVEALASITVRHGHAALPARVRRQIGVEPNGTVGLALAGQRKPDVVTETVRPCHLVLADPSDAKDGPALLAAQEMERLGLQAGLPVRIFGQNPQAGAVTTKLMAVEGSRPRTLTLPAGLMDKLSLTIGEVVRLEAA